MVDLASIMFFPPAVLSVTSPRAFCVQLVRLFAQLNTARGLKWSIVFGGVMGPVDRSDNPRPWPSENCGFYSFTMKPSFCNYRKYSTFPVRRVRDSVTNGISSFVCFSQIKLLP